MTMVSPVMYLASSEHKNDTAPAHSSGWPNLGGGGGGGGVISAIISEGDRLIVYKFILALLMEGHP